MDFLVQLFFILALLVDSIGALPNARRLLNTYMRNTVRGPTYCGGRLHDVDSAQESLKRLRLERERKRKELIATEIAVKKMETELETMYHTAANKTDEELPVVSPTYDYGYVSQSDGANVATRNAAGEEVPASAIVLALSNFRRELKNIFNTYGRTAQESVTQTQINTKSPTAEYDSREKLKLLKLSNDAIWKREARRPPIKAPWILKGPYFVLCAMLDALFEEDPISRFYFLETVARMPYFSYIFMLHTYETLGWWRRSAEAKRVHFAEEYNEYNHLLIMEALGGDQQWRVRFLAQHSAVAYYFVLLFLWIMSPSLAYNFSELIEAHAVDTYEEFAESNKPLLQTMAAPEVAKAYYENADMYIFDEFQTGIEKGTRRPVVNTLYDVFRNIRDDERAHVKTMAQCQDPEVIVRSPNTEAAIAIAAAAGVAVAGYLTYGVIDFDLTEFVNSAPGAIEEAAAGAASTVGAVSGEAVNVMENADSSVNAVETIVEGGMLSALMRYLATFLPFLL